jgi:hypothetical protein
MALNVPGFATNINTKTTTVIKKTSGTLLSVHVNTAGTADTIKIYDNSSAAGTVIGTITSMPIGSRDFNVLFNVGLTIVTGGTTAGDYTIVYQ